jgi:RNA polymerase sigma-70 factor (ECF subfamily)
MGVKKPLASDSELAEFLKNTEKKAFKRTYYHVRNEEAALDILQDSMIKLCTHYADKPLAELPMLFQRILSNTTLDWFRRRKTRSALFSNFSDFGNGSDDESFDILEILERKGAANESESAQDLFSRTQTVRLIESEIQNLPGRQREAFLLRYWEDLDVAETAAAMGCSEGSVKTHCSRAVQSLFKALSSKGIRP